MKRWLETQGYLLCWRGDWISDVWSRFWFRWYCPYPIKGSDGWTARACIAAGNCGCSNGPQSPAGTTDQ